MRCKYADLRIFRENRPLPYPFKCTCCLFGAYDLSMFGNRGLCISCENQPAHQKRPSTARSSWS